MEYAFSFITGSALQDLFILFLILVFKRLIVSGKDI